MRSCVRGFAGMGLREEWGRLEGASGGVACGESPDAEVNNHPTAPTPALHDSSTFRLPF